MAATGQTKKAIQIAFMELLEEHPLGKIKVRDITDSCGINRNTFYYHYQDIPALLEEICAQETERIVGEYPTIHSLEECLEASMKFGLEHKRAVMNIYRSDNRSTYVQSVWRMCEGAVTTYINTVCKNIRISETDKMLIIRYTKCEIFGVVIDWISTGMKEEYLQGMRRIFQLMRGSTEEMIRRSQMTSGWE
ncbi:MAG: TetR/AcrR family transcriptional regulator [Oscillospiraceae bacterium]|nr:TetR/AcrR family transcriptional regulator [Oscillospiraceae bacterium]